MTSPTCTVESTATTNGVDLTPAATATIALADVAGVTSWSILAVNTDELNLAAAINSTLVVDSITKTATFTVPAAGSAVVFESVVNNGRDVNGRVTAAYTTRFAIYTLTTTGFRVCAFDESLEGNASFGWIAKLNPLIRSATTSPASAGAGLTFSLGAYNVVAADDTLTINADSMQVKTGDGLIANANGVSVAAGDGSITVGANSIAVGVISDAQHGARGNGTLHSVATASFAGFMPTAHFSLVNSATASATNDRLALRDGSAGCAFGVVTATEINLGTSATGYVRSANNAVAAGSSTQVFLKSGDQSNVGSSGLVRVESGAAPANTGTVTIASGNSSAATSGAISITSGAGLISGAVAISTGAASSTSSGAINITTGNAATNVGGIGIACGSSGGTGQGGSITLLSGGSSAGSNRGGDISLVVGFGAAGYGNIALGAAPASYGNGLRVVYLRTAQQAPTTNPVSGYFLYIDPIDLRLKVRGPSGTVTTLASA